ncbi:sensory box histidine kinase/response regulator [Stutzerimonas stutzeri]|uniref:PAS domain-containing hybrid sensor histidine kinase/response regulator n=1 Tax=Stutzerimonas stutzeri subgroup TaxID=578833 RepID=UPI000C6E85EE|nr:MULTISPECIES: NahK/ErcS family hybrid sensor histidine kinase/response regulator [Stutzerimonas stutzeri subgroup]MCQ2046205.1 ATP-binding protein [Stutzerimonas kunmingensis]PKR26900.1 hybrid sensor histidine kinase/response regulator [Stutzerimonas stutzeri]QQC09706.1 response regulator [Stutzerimonas stutzeri]VEI34647.1 sensory box histidine kinase/response regulator [Stutzerimonas stutzeri]
MPKPSDDQHQALAQLLGFGSHSARKSHYPELVARLEELEGERNRYKWLFEHAVHGIFQASIHEGIRAANPALARMLNYDTPEEALWALTDLSHHLFIGGEEELRQIRHTLSQQHGLFGYETRLRRKDGSAIYVIMNLLLKPDEDGLVEGFVADVTERKLAQLRLLQLNEELEQRVAERTCELREARDAAEAANLSKDKYLAAASHDLLQPLNAARLLISTLRERKLPQNELHLVERAHQALEGAEDLLTDLLDISKLDQAAIKPDIDIYSLDDVLLPLVSEFQSVAAAAGLQLKHYIPRVAIKTDFRLLTRILRNFLSNACRYTDQGCVLVGARMRAGALRIEVWDTGRGIPEEELQSIFLEFNQLGIGRSAKRSGVGLGLAIVDRIASMLGYQVLVRSKPGRGSVFSIDVPLAEAMPRERVAAPAVVPQLGDPLPGRRLLVIDNEESILLSMAALLEQWGCTVVTATDEQSAMTALDGVAPDAILADYHLDHGLTGWDVVLAVRGRFNQALPVVMITADRSDQCRQQLQGCGVPVLNKPVKPGKMRSVLSHLLAGNGNGNGNGGGQDSG